MTMGVSGSVSLVAPFLVLDLCTNLHMKRWSSALPTVGGGATDVLLLTNTKFDLKTQKLDVFDVA